MTSLILELSKATSLNGKVHSMYHSIENTILIMPLSVDICNKSHDISKVNIHDLNICLFSSWLPFICYKWNSTSVDIVHLPLQKPFQDVYSITVLCSTPAAVSSFPLILTLSTTTIAPDTIIKPMWVDLLSPVEGILTHNPLLPLLLSIRGNGFDPSSTSTFLELRLSSYDNTTDVIPYDNGNGNNNDNEGMLLHVSFDEDSLGTHVFDVTPVTIVMTTSSSDNIQQQQQHHHSSSVRYVRGVTSSFLLEIVPSSQTLDLSRRYFALTRTDTQTHTDTVVSAWNSGITPSQFMHVAGGAFDGQLKVFADQWRDHPYVTLIRLPLMRLSLPLLHQKPSVSEPSYIDLYGPVTDSTTVYTYIVERLRLSNYILSEVSPPWVRTIWTTWREIFRLPDRAIDTDTVIVTGTGTGRASERESDSDSDSGVYSYHYYQPDLVSIGNTAHVSDLIAPELGM
eukprot:gene10407-21704_t